MEGRGTRAAQSAAHLFVQHLTPLDERRRQVPGPGRSSPTARCVWIASTSRCPTSGGPPSPMAACSHARAQDPARRRDQGGHGGLRSGADGPDGWRSPPSPVPPPRRSPGVDPARFQVLYRTRSMDAAARLMEGHGMPPPSRGVRQHGRASHAGRGRTRPAAPTSASWARREKHSASVPQGKRSATRSDRRARRAA